MKFKLRSLFLLVSCILFISFSSVSFASDLDILVGTQSSQQNTGSSNNSGQSDNNSGGLTGYLQDYNPITDENMAIAEKLSSPAVVIIGNIVGIIVILTISMVTFTTACDFAYIGIPFMRGLLDSRHLISDEARMSLGGSASTGNTQSTGMGMNSGGMGMSSGGLGMGSGGMGLGSGGFGMGSGGFGMNSGGMGAGLNSQSSASTPKTKSVIMTYLQKRVVFIVILVVALILLTSSLLFDCGINVAMLGIKIMDKFNQFIGGISF